MYAIVLLFFHIVKGEIHNESNIHVSDVADSLLDIFHVDNERIKELKEKIKKIDTYIIDKNKYSEYLINQTISTDLNETNFYYSLNDSDSFHFLLNAESKNLYLQMKEKMNRDDIMRILSGRSDNSKLVKSARKMMARGTQKVSGDDVVDVLIDKIIAQKPEDHHRFDYRKENHSNWDPQGELEDLRDYHKHNARRIFKGERTTIKYYPFMVSVHVMGRFWCGGVIYQADIVITSAACLQLMYNNRFYRENPSSLEVRVGSNHSRIGGEIIEALEVYFHPGYNPRTLRHNIALIRLRRHIFFGYHRVPKRIDISTNDLGISPTSEVLVLGWGVTKMTQKLSYEPIFLNRKILPVYPNIFCKEVYGSNFVTTTMFCAGTFTTGEGACDHDAGGPAVISGKLVGVISFGPAVCGYPNTPTVFTLVGAYAEWIETVANNMPSYYQGRKRTTTKGPFLMYSTGFVIQETTREIENATTPTLRQQKLVESDGWSIEMEEQ